MNLTIDIGNTLMKWAFFDADTLVDHGAAPASQLPEVCNSRPWQKAIVFDSGQADLSCLADCHAPVHLLSPSSRLPIKIDYATPHTLGADRIAAACGAWKHRKGETSVVIDAGTCITVDLLDNSGTYRGGAILPGITMKFRALHTFTAKLPLLDNSDSLGAPLTGRTTEQSIVAGVVTATRFAVDGFIRHYRNQYGHLGVVLTGGDADKLWGNGVDPTGDNLLDPTLTMTGLNEILKQNER